MNSVFISEDEKKRLFDSLIECNKRIDEFISEAHMKINDSIHQINGLGERITNLEKKIKK